MLNSQANFTTFTPIQFPSDQDIESITRDCVIQWINSRPSSYGMEDSGNTLVMADSSDEARAKMANEYADKIIGFAKEPSVTIKVGESIKQHTIDMLKNLKLSTRFPARLNLPINGPDNCIHVTGPIAEASLMLFNTVLPRYYKPMAFILYYYYKNDLNYDKAEMIISDYYLTIVETAEQQTDVHMVLQKIKERMIDYFDHHKIPIKNIMMQTAQDIFAGKASRIVDATQHLQNFLADLPAQKYIRDVIQQLYRFTINEVRMYKDYEKAFQNVPFLPVTTESRDVIYINAIVMPSAVVRLGTDKENEGNLFQPMIKRLRMQKPPRGIAHPDSQEVNSLGDYRVKFTKTNYQCSARSRNQPQIFFSCDQRFNLDIAFYYDHHLNQIVPYDVFSYDGFKKNMTDDVRTPLYYQDTGLDFVKKKFHFRVSHFLSDYKIGSHRAYVYNGFYWPTAWAIYGPIHHTNIYYDTDKAFYDGVQKVYYSHHHIQLLPNATAVNKICEDGLKIDPPIITIKNVKETGVFDDNIIKGTNLPEPTRYMDYPDYPFYNYAYSTNYMVKDITLATPQNARIFYQQNIKKINTKRFVNLEEDNEAY